MPDRFAAYDLWVFDADDTLRRTLVPGRPCPYRETEWELLPGVAETLRPVQWNRLGGPRLGLASNQDRVGYGHLSERAARALLRSLALAAAGVTLPDAALQLCPHRAEEGCECRKPRPGMILRLMRHYRVGAGRTVFVGNHENDRRAAAAAGVRFLEARDLFSSSAAPSGRRSRRTPRPAAEGWYGGDESRRTRG